MYVVYMMMHHNTTAGKHLLAKVRVDAIADYQDAVILQKRAEWSFAMANPAHALRQISTFVLQLNPQAGAVKTEFVIRSNY